MQRENPNRFRQRQHREPPLRLSICYFELRRVRAACERRSAAAPFRPVRLWAAPVSVASSVTRTFRQQCLLDRCSSGQVCDRPCSRTRSGANMALLTLGAGSPHCTSNVPPAAAFPDSQPVGHSILSCIGCVCCASPCRSQCCSRPVRAHSPQRDGAFSRLPFGFAFAFDFALGCDLSAMPAGVPTALAPGTSRAADCNRTWAAWPV